VPPYERWLTRRRAIVAALAAVGGSASMMAFASVPTESTSVGRPAGAAPAGGLHDWDWLVGAWKVRHRRLKARLAGSTDWEEFDGTSTTWLSLGGLGTLDDNLLEFPGGTYRAIGVRAFDPSTERWAVWGLDSRHPTVIQPPVFGGFKDGVGTFLGDGMENGKPIQLRFLWSKITARSAHWEQAFSPDRGATWETNWTMEFRRVSA
jgi:hypothetical protein